MRLSNGGKKKKKIPRQFFGGIRAGKILLTPPVISFPDYFASPTRGEQEPSCSGPISSDSFSSRFLSGQDGLGLLAFMCGTTGQDCSLKNKLFSEILFEMEKKEVFFFFFFNFFLSYI